MSDALRQATLRRLTSELASRRFWARIPGHEFSDDPAETAAIVEAMLAIGTLSSEEAAEWRARFERAVAPPPPDPAARARVVEHLEALRDREETGDRVDQLDAAVTAFAGVYLLSPEEAHDWRGEPRETRSAVTGVNLTIGEAESPFDDSVVRDVLLGPERRVAGLRVTAVELYDGAVVVNWHYSATPGESPAADALWRRIALAEIHDEEVDDDFGDGLDDDEWFERDEAFRLTDDVGTRYSSWTGGSASLGDGVRAVTGHSGFAPGAPAGASRLQIVVEGEALSIELG